MEVMCWKVMFNGRWAAVGAVLTLVKERVSLSYTKEAVINLSSIVLSGFYWTSTTSCVNRVDDKDISKTTPFLSKTLPAAEISGHSKSSLAMCEIHSVTLSK